MRKIDENDLGYSLLLMLIHLFVDIHWIAISNFNVLISTYEYIDITKDLFFIYFDSSIDKKMNINNIIKISLNL